MRPTTPLRRVLEAVGNVAAEMQATKSIVNRLRPVQGWVTTGTRQFLIRSTQNVIDHYRRVLANHQMSEAEEKEIQVCLAEKEGLLRDLLGTQEQQMPGRGFS